MDSLNSLSPLSKYDPSIEFNCVLNSHILRALSLYDELESTEGVKDSCRFLNKEILSLPNNKCTFYYPNKFIFPYYYSLAFKSGVKCLEKGINQVINYILKEQNQDGSWDALSIDDSEFKNYSTAMAIGALLNVNTNEIKVKDSIKKGITYLIKNKKPFENTFYWPGSISFTTDISPNYLMVWKSDAETTSIVLTVFLDYLRLMDPSSDSMRSNLKGIFIKR